MAADFTISRHVSHFVLPTTLRTEIEFSGGHLVACLLEQFVRFLVSSIGEDFVVFHHRGGSRPRVHTSGCFTLFHHEAEFFWAPGFHTREPKRAHLSAPALQTPPKFHERTPKRWR